VHRCRPRRRRYAPLVEAPRLTPDQTRRLLAQLRRNLDYYQRLADRLEHVGFPEGHDARLYALAIASQVQSPAWRMEQGAAGGVGVRHYEGDRIYDPGGPSVDDAAAAQSPRAPDSQAASPRQSVCSHT
jgi:hypothetical protein